MYWIVEICYNDVELRELRSNGAIRISVSGKSTFDTHIIKCNKQVFCNQQSEVIQSMGVYFNPSNESFTKDRNYKIYIDKTGLLEYLNESIGTPKNCIALSHARRFGKSHAAGMIDAYYSLGSG